MAKYSLRFLYGSEEAKIGAAIEAETLEEAQAEAAAIFQQSQIEAQTENPTQVVVLFTDKITGYVIREGSSSGVNAGQIMALRRRR